MRLLKIHVFTTLMLICFCQDAVAQSASGLIDSGTAKRFGMEIMWRTQVRMGPVSKLQSIAQVFGKSKTLVKYVVTFEDIVEEFYEDDVDRFGREIGVSGAKSRADARLVRYQEIDPASAKLQRVVEDPAVLKAAYAATQAKYEAAQGFEKGRLAQEMIAIESRRQRLLPEITFLAQSSTSMVQSIDGRNGKTNWVQQVGSRNHPSQPVVAKRDHFAVVNASDLYCGLLKNGRVVWQRECRGAPGARLAMTRYSVFVPMVDGFVEQFLIGDGNAATGDIVSIGHSLLGATSSDSVVAWPSDRGELNVAFDERETSKVSYRLVPKREIVSNAAFQSPYLFATSTDGSIYCLREASGNLIWDLPTGVPISNSPFPIDDFVYFVNDNHDLTQVSIEGGLPIWTAAGISEVVTVSKNRIYCLDRQKHLVILNTRNGGYEGALTSEPVEFVYQNSMTDRLVVGTERGQIQCLREIAQVEPIFHQQPEKAKESTEDTGKKPQNQPSTQPGGNDDNPFGGGKGGGADDPFGNPFGGGGGGKADPADDPFGGGGNGRGNGGAKKNDDPFGGGATNDPFGN